MHQTRLPSALFSPIFSRAREKIGPPEARQKRPRRNEPPQATSLILCARFFLSKPQTKATPHRRNLSGIVENMIRFTYE